MTTSGRLTARQQSLLEQWVEYELTLTGDLRGQEYVHGTTLGAVDLIPNSGDRPRPNIPISEADLTALASSELVRIIGYGGTGSIRCALGQEAFDWYATRVGSPPREPYLAEIDAVLGDELASRRHHAWELFERGSSDDLRVAVGDMREVARGFLDRLAPKAEVKVALPPGEDPSAEQRINWMLPNAGSEKRLSGVAIAAAKLGGNLYGLTSKGFHAGSPELESRLVRGTLELYEDYLGLISIFATDVSDSADRES